MTDLLDQLHADAGLGLLAADVGLRVYDGRVPDNTNTGAGPELPYVLVYTTVKWPPDGTANALDAQAVTVEVEWNCHCVAETAAAARAVQMRVRAALLNKRPTIAGRSVGLIKQEEVLPPNRDESTGRLVMDCVSNYTLVSAPG